MQNFQLVVRYRIAEKVTCIKRLDCRADSFMLLCNTAQADILKNFLKAGFSAQIHLEADDFNWQLRHIYSNIDGVAIIEDRTEHPVLKQCLGGNL